MFRAIPHKMHDQEPQFLQLGEGARRRRIAYRQGAGEGQIALLWLSGFMSDMVSTKATALAAWAAANGVRMLRFDYSGHGLSEGSLAEATIGDWLEESIAAARLAKSSKLIVIGSSMGGWLALLLARHLARSGANPLAGLVLIAPAHDMTEALIWKCLPEEARAAIERDGVYYQASDYAEPYPITRQLIEEGRAHLLEGNGFDPLCPVRILQGMQDPDVPWSHALSLVDLLIGNDVELSLIKDGDHRLSRPQDIARLEAAVSELVAKAGDDHTR
jgi:pimeloyl-ACP methyl ester carboxylesterase